jgi:hypothetical protein
MSRERAALADPLEQFPPVVVRQPDVGDQQVKPPGGARPQRVRGGPDGEHLVPVPREQHDQDLGAVRMVFDEQDTHAGLCRKRGIWASERLRLKGWRIWGRERGEPNDPCECTPAGP